MADWSKSVVEHFLRLAKDNSELAKLIYATIKRLEHNPTQGEYISNTQRFYTDYQHGFRIGYNSHPSKKEIEIVTLHLFSPQDEPFI